MGSQSWRYIQVCTLDPIVSQVGYMGRTWQLARSPSTQILGRKVKVCKARKRWGIEEELQ